MSVTTSNSISRPTRWGWGILVGLCGLLAVNGLLLYFVIVETPQEQTLAILLTGFGVLALVVAVEGFRNGTRWAWNASWVVVALLAAVGLHMLAAGRSDLSTFYLVLGAVALVGQLLTRREHRSGAGV